jgi:murein DD-endopeptidase MepM/ murein hydrolase activator NlpD
MRPKSRNSGKTAGLVLLFFFCAGFAAFAQNTRFRYALIPETPTPGEPVTIGISAGDAYSIKSAVLYTTSGKKLSSTAFFDLPTEAENLKAAVLAVPATAQPGFAVSYIEGNSGTVTEFPLVIRERQFESEEIALNEVLTGIRTDPDPQKTAESEQLWGILSRTGTGIYFTGNFIPPVTSTRRTSHFGDRRVYRYSNGRSDLSIHAGVDYGVPTGTPVKACAGGKVLLARSRIVTGNSVVIEHLPGVYSLYYHLDKIEIGEGALVEAGTLLGLSGATGLATGPHLHWEIRVSGENTDPDAFIQRPILDKDAILTIMRN